MSIENAKKLSKTDWENRATKIKNELDRKTGLFINGKFVTESSQPDFQTVNPATNEVLVQITQAGAPEVELAVVAAERAWRSGGWQHSHPRKRMEVLFKLAELVDHHAEELAVLDSLDMGKPISDMLNIDLPEVVVTIRYYAEAVDKMFGSISPNDNENLHLTFREPIGVVGAISPWNYPLLMAIWKVAPALAAGNAVVLKPSEVAPLSCLRLAELFIEAGGPPGIFNVINGGGETGKHLALHPRVDKITFTGSTTTGKKILGYAGESNMKKVALETGGKSPQIFLSDLPDLDTAVDYAYGGIYDNAGQVCNAGSRLLVQENLVDQFTERFKERSSYYQPGEPLDPHTTLGPLCSAQQKKNVIEKITAGSREDAKLLFGGDSPSKFSTGEYLNPALIQGNNDMTVAREEIFGPVAVMIPFKDQEEAIKIANDTIYGLAASVWTSNLTTAHRMIQQLEAGVIWVNCFGDGDMNQPFGGFKQSGNSRDKSMESLLSYTQIKSAWIKL